MLPACFRYVLSPGFPTHTRAPFTASTDDVDSSCRVFRPLRELPRNSLLVLIMATLVPGVQDAPDVRRDGVADTSTASCVHRARSWLFLSPRTRPLLKTSVRVFRAKCSCPSLSLVQETEGYDARAQLSMLSSGPIAEACGSIQLPGITSPAKRILQKGPR